MKIKLKKEIRRTVASIAGFVLNYHTCKQIDNNITDIIFDSDYKKGLRFYEKHLLKLIKMYITELILFNSISDKVILTIKKNKNWSVDNVIKYVWNACKEELLEKIKKSIK